ncbi:MAG: glycosyltransferase family 2 protein [Parcubacteria group bacterium]|nr:glycosyltransferase family 2 protein [Parcubacteria group bacterium]
MISVVFPAYNEEENVANLHSIIKKTMDDLDEPYEIIAVENGSQDGTLNELKKLSPVRIVVIAKNIGQTAGLDAGFKVAVGDIVVTMDADLQNDPGDIPRLISKFREGYDVVSGWRRDRHDNWGRRVLSRSANWLTWKVTGLYLHDHACALKAYSRPVLRDINLYGEMHVFLPAILYMRGAKVAELEVTHHARTKGFSKHNFLKAVKDISDLLVIKFIFSGARPFIFFGSLAVTLWLLSFVSAAGAVIMKLLEYRNFGQTPLPLLTFFLITTGLIFFAMGFLAELLIRVYYESKGGRPYLVKEVVEKS